MENTIKFWFTLHGFDWQKQYLIFYHYCCHLIEVSYLIWHWEFKQVQSVCIPGNQHVPEVLHVLQPPHLGDLGSLARTLTWTRLEPLELGRRRMISKLSHVRQTPRICHHYCRHSGNNLKYWILSIKKFRWGLAKYNYWHVEYSFVFFHMPVSWVLHVYVFRIFKIQAALWHCYDISHVSMIFYGNY